MPVGKLGQLFQRLDRNQDSRVTRDEVEAFGRAAKVDSGLFGGAKLSGTADQMMSTFDKDRDGGIGWREFVEQSSGLLPASLRGAADGGAVDREVDALFKRADKAPADGALSQSELEGVMRKELDASGTSQAGIKAEIGAKVAVRALDTDGNRQVSRGELAELAKDILRERAKLLHV